MYHIKLARSAEKELSHIPEPYFSSLARKIDGLVNQPFPAGVKKIKGTQAGWRVRAGDYRIIYEVDESTKTVNISAIGHRKEIYK